MPANTGDVVRKPAWGRVLPPDERPIPPGVDYADEVLGRGTTHPTIDDPINVVVGSNSYVASPGKSWLPWAYRPAAHPMGLPEPLAFTRYYPTRRICVDVHPSKANLDALAQSQLQDERTFKHDLCKAHGVGYVALHADEEVDARMFALALEIGAQPMEEDPVERASGITMDALQAPYIVNAGLAQLPWAFRVVVGQKEGFVFSRYYYTLGLCLDLYPAHMFMTTQERDRAEADIATRTALCEANSTAYRAVFGLEHLEAALAAWQSSGREPPVPEPASPEFVQPPRPGGRRVTFAFTRKREPEF